MGPTLGVVPALGAFSFVPVIWFVFVSPLTFESWALSAVRLLLLLLLLLPLPVLKFSQPEQTSVSQFIQRSLVLALGGFFFPLPTALFASRLRISLFEPRVHVAVGRVSQQQVDRGRLREDVNGSQQVGAGFVVAVKVQVRPKRTKKSLSENFPVSKMWQKIFMIFVLRMESVVLPPEAATSDLSTITDQQLGHIWQRMGLDPAALAERKRTACKVNGPRQKVRFALAGCAFSTCASRSRSLITLPVLTGPKTKHLTVISFRPRQKKEHCFS